MFIIYLIKGGFQVMYYILTAIAVIFILLIPEFIKFARIKHMKSLGYRYEGDELVRIQENDHKAN